MAGPGGPKPVIGRGKLGNLPIGKGRATTRTGKLADLTVKQSQIGPQIKPGKEGVRINVGVSGKRLIHKPMTQIKGFRKIPLTSVSTKNGVGFQGVTRWTLARARMSAGAKFLIEGFGEKVAELHQLIAPALPYVKTIAISAAMALPVIAFAKATGGIGIGFGMAAIAPFLMIGSSEIRFLEHKTEFTIGRNGESDILLRDPTVSRRHAKLFERDGNWYIENINGQATYVERANPRSPKRTNLLDASRAPVRLQEGDILQLGRERIPFHIPEEREGPQFLEGPPTPEVFETNPYSERDPLPPESMEGEMDLPMHMCQMTDIRTLASFIIFDGVPRAATGKLVFGRGGNSEIQLTGKGIGERHFIVEGSFDGPVTIHRTGRLRKGAKVSIFRKGESFAIGSEKVVLKEGDMVSAGGQSFIFYDRMTPAELIEFDQIEVERKYAEEHQHAQLYDFSSNAASRARQRARAKEEAQGGYVDPNPTGFYEVATGRRIDTKDGSRLPAQTPPLDPISHWVGQIEASHDWFRLKDILRTAGLEGLPLDVWDAMGAEIDASVTNLDYLDQTTDYHINDAAGALENVERLGLDQAGRRVGDSLRYADNLEKMGFVDSAADARRQIEESLVAEGLIYEEGQLHVVGAGKKFRGETQISRRFSDAVRAFMDHPELFKPESDGPEETAAIVAPMGFRDGYDIYRGAASQVLDVDVVRAMRDAGEGKLDFPERVGDVRGGHFMGWMMYQHRHSEKGDTEGRFYLTINGPEYATLAPRVAEAMAMRLHAGIGRDAFYFKMSPTGKGAKRRDHIVVYFNSAKELEVVRALRSVVLEIGESHFSEKGPYFTQSVSRGLSFGEEPLDRGRVSFGEVRDHAFAQAWGRIRFYQQHGIDLPMSSKVRIVAHYFDKNGLSVKNPAFNKGGEKKFPFIEWSSRPEGEK